VKRIDRYIFRQLFVATVFVATALTGVVWLTQSLRFIEMIVNRGLSVPLFIYFTLLLLPTFLSIILPIALFVAVVFTYNRLLTDSELVVLRAGGCSQFGLAKPAINLAVLTALVCFSLTAYFIPASYREFKDMQFTLRNSLPTIMLQEGVFNSIMKGVTVYVRNRSRNGELSGIIIHDSRDPKKPVTMIAEKGAIVTSKTGPRVVLANGNRQQVNEKDGRLSLLYFDRYSFDIGTISQTTEIRWREPRERYLGELFDPAPNDSWKRNKLIMEGHHRLSLPLLPIAFTLVALAFMLGGEFNRRGQMGRVLCAVGIIILIETGQLGIKNLGDKTPEIAFLMYVVPAIPALLALVYLGPRRRKQRKPGGAPAMTV
jgi:lipopolysaccharide export system permease protein